MSASIITLGIDTALGSEILFLGIYPKDIICVQIVGLNDIHICIFKNSLIFGHGHDMQKFPGQESNPYHSSDSSHSSGSAESLTC